MVQKGIRLAASKLQFIIIIKSMALFFLAPTQLLQAPCLGTSVFNTQACRIKFYDLKCKMAKTPAGQKLLQKIKKLFQQSF